MTVKSAFLPTYTKGQTIAPAVGAVTISIGQGNKSLVVSNFGTNGVNSLSELARLATKAGWKTSVETKKFDNGSFQRVTLISNSTPKRTYTILVEPNKKLPMELQMSIDDKKKTRVIVALRWRQSDKPLTQEDLDPKIKTAPHVDGEMAKKPGI